MGKYDNNLIVVGAGSAGLIAALVGATARAEVTLIEADRMGGDCLNTGCIPSKTLIASARVAHSIRNSQEFGIEVPETKIHFEQVMDRIRDAIAEIEPHDSVERYTKMGVRCIEGRARLVDPHCVSVNGEEISSRSIVLATGARPQIPPIPGLREANPLTTESLWDITELPRRLVVIGGGPVGCELAQAFARLGSQVTVVEQMDRLLPQEDPDASELVNDAMQADGVEVRTSFSAVSCTDAQLSIRSSDRTETVDFDQVLVAVGRAPRSDSIGLDSLGVSTRDDGRVEVNQYLQTLVSSIYASGDLVGPHQFTHLAAQQGWYASMNALLRPFWRFKFDSQVSPWAVFTDPEVARVGKSEQELTEQGIDYETTRFDLSASDRAIAEGRTDGFVKLFTPPKSDRLLGACIVGANAGELIGSCVNAMTHGYGMDKVFSTLHVYPTWSEAVRHAAGARRKKQVSPKLLELAGRLNTILR